MKRLKPGEYIAMSDEQKKAHRKQQRIEWINIPGNLEKVRASNRIYQRKHWTEVRLTPFIKQCKRCGKTATIYGRGVICSDCKSIPSKNQIKRDIIQERKEKKQTLYSKIIFLATTTTMFQREIAEELGTYQEYVSKVLREHNLRRGAYTNTKKEEK